MGWPALTSLVQHGGVFLKITMLPWEGLCLSPHFYGTFEGMTIANPAYNAPK
jgi:hypothetical protein